MGKFSKYHRKVTDRVVLRHFEQPGLCHRRFMFTLGLKTVLQVVYHSTKLSAFQHSETPTPLFLGSPPPPSKRAFLPVSRVNWIRASQSFGLRPYLCSLGTKGNLSVFLSFFFFLLTKKLLNRVGPLQKRLLSPPTYTEMSAPVTGSRSHLQ